MGYLPKKGVSFELVEFKAAAGLCRGASSARTQSFSRSPTLLWCWCTVWRRTGMPDRRCFWDAILRSPVMRRSPTTVPTPERAFEPRNSRLREEVDAAVAFARARRFENIFLAGHSLGTPIIEYYEGDNPSPVVKALAFSGRTSKFQASQRSPCSVPICMRSLLRSATVGCKRQWRRD